MHPTWAGDLFHPRKYTCFDAVLLKHPILAFSHRDWFLYKKRLRHRNAQRVDHGEQGGKMAKPRREASGETRPVYTLVLDF